MAQTLGAYEVGETLGGLPFGELVALTDPARPMPVVAVILAPALAREYRFRTSLRLAIARAGSLRHPAVTHPREVREADGQLAVVYETSADRPVTAQAADASALPAERRLDAIRSIADALDAAHQRMLVHGLLAPSTVLVGADGSVAMVGLGLLAAVEEAGLADLLDDSDVDLRYIAPEQTAAQRAVMTADGYALGVLASDLLGGSQADPALAATLARQTSEAPSARYPSCRAFADALQAVGFEVDQSTADESKADGPVVVEAEAIEPVIGEREADASPVTAPPVVIAPPPEAAPSSEAIPRRVPPPSIPTPTPAPAPPRPKRRTATRAPLPVEPARPAYPEDVIPVTPALRTTLERAWKAERWKLIWKVGIWVVIVAAAGYFLTGFNIFAIGVALFVLFSMVQQSRRRMQQLGLVAKDTSLRRIYGPVRTVELRGRTSRNKVQHPVTLANGTLVYVDGAAHQALGDVGRIATDEDGRTLGDDGSGSGIPIVVDYATVTYSATVPLILEIRDKSDRVIYTV